jgi:serine/threonine-protein kinase
VQSTRNIDHRSDIYALGCILFQLVTGHAPFDGTLRELLMQHRTKPAPRLRSIVPGISVELDELVASMLAKHPDDRPQTMHEVQQALAGKELATTRPAPAPELEPEAPQPATPRKLGLALLAVAGVLGFCLSCGAV